MDRLSTVGLGVSICLSVLTADEVYAQPVVEVRRACANGVCGETKYYGGRVRIKLTSQLSRHSHFNFKTNPGAQIELKREGNYSFDRPPGDRGTHSAQACSKSGLSRSVCTQWATFRWSSGR